MQKKRGVKERKRTNASHDYIVVQRFRIHEQLKRLASDEVTW